MKWWDFVLFFLLLNYVPFHNVPGASGRRIRTKKLFSKNFISVRYDSFNERELRIAFNRVLVLEVTSFFDAAPDIVILEVTNGRKLVQNIYQEGQLKDCHFTESTKSVLKFVERFVGAEKNGHFPHGNAFETYEAKPNNSSSAVQYFKNVEFLLQFRPLVDIHALSKSCHKFYKHVKHDVRKNGPLATFTPYRASLLKGHIGETRDNADIEDPKEEKLPPLNSTEPVKRSRSKRALSIDFNSVLIFPGTKWCGKGDLASCFEDLGPDEELDVCCRDHDCCPHIIPPFSTRYNTFNYRLHSVIHCDCDYRFKGCLKNSVSSTASLIGKIYFNILGSKCFTFEKHDVCIQRHWYGSCKKYESQPKAIVKSQEGFEH